MKYILAILIMIGSAFAQNTNYRDGTECNCDSIISGDSTFYNIFPIYAGTIYIEIPITQGKIDGRINQYFYQDNKEYLSSVIYYFNNRIEKEVTYYNDGDILSQTWYENGKLVKTNIYSNIDGSVSSEFYFNKQKIWSHTEYYDSGAVKYIGGCLDGTGKWYFENGKLAGTATYKNGELIGYKKCTDGRFGNENLDCLN